LGREKQRLIESKASFGSTEVKGRRFTLSRGSVRDMGVVVVNSAKSRTDANDRDSIGVLAVNRAKARADSTSNRTFAGFAVYAQ